MSLDAPRDFIAMTPLHRLGQSEEIAEVVAFLVSEQGGRSIARTLRLMVE